MCQRVDTLIGMPELLLGNNSQYDMIIAMFVATKERSRLIDFVHLPTQSLNVLYRPRGQQITLVQGAIALLRVFRPQLWLAYSFAIMLI